MFSHRWLSVAATAAMLVVGAQAFACPDTDTPPASGTKASVAPADSTAAAFATVMAYYLRPEIEKRFPADTAAVKSFIEGVRQAFVIKHSTDAYYFGVRSGFGLIDRVESMQEMGFPFSPEQFCDALADAIRGKAMGFDTASADAYLREIVDRMNPPEKALDAASQQAFLDAQKQREGVHEMPSGLLFEVITEGEGASPADTDKVRVIYTGKLADGTVFDETDRPIEFPVQGLVPGFTEGLKMMKTGGEYRLFIPADLGYGSRGAAGVIPPGAALDFTVRLLDVVRPTPEAPAAASD